jgi:hypothetical protein
MQLRDALVKAEANFGGLAFCSWKNPGVVSERERDVAYVKLSVLREDFLFALKKEGRELTEGLLSAALGMGLMDGYKKGYLTFRKTELDYIGKLVELGANIEEKVFVKGERQTVALLLSKQFPLLEAHAPRESLHNRSFHERTFELLTNEKILEEDGVAIASNVIRGALDTVSKANLQMPSRFLPEKMIPLDEITAGLLGSLSEKGVDLAKAVQSTMRISGGVRAFGNIGYSERLMHDVLPMTYNKLLHHINAAQQMDADMRGTLRVKGTDSSGTNQFVVRKVIKKPSKP